MNRKLLKTLAFSLMLVFVLSFQVCAVGAAEVDYAAEAQSLENTFSQMLQTYGTEEAVDEMIAGQIASYEQMGYTGVAEQVEAMYGFLYTWVELKAEAGEFIGIKDFTYTEGETSIESAVVIVECENAEIQLNYSVNEDGSLNVTLEKQATFAEKMQKAAMNTLMGMGTVFVVLIFICGIISLFKCFNKNGENVPAPKTTPVPATPAVSAPVVAEDVTNDLELVAVISAAIAAAEGTSVEGFRVRSIKRMKVSNW